MWDEECLNSVQKERRKYLVKGNKTKDWALVHKGELFKISSYNVFRGLDD